MLARKDIIPNSSYSEDTILAQEGYFKPFIIEALGDVTDLSLGYKNHKEKNNSDNRDLKNLRKELKVILKDSDDDIMKAYYFLKSNHKTRVKFYFKKSPSNVKGNFKRTVLLFEEVLNKIKNETNNELNDFEPILRDLLNKLTDINKEIHNKSTDIKFNDNEINKIFIDWKKKYARLKDYVKGFLRGTDLDYRIFFLDLISKKTSSSSKNTKEEVKEEVKEETNKEEVNKDTKEEDTKEENKEE